MSARRDRQSYQSLYSITRNGKVNTDLGANKRGKRLGNGREVRVSPKKGGNGFKWWLL